MDRSGAGLEKLSAHHPGAGKRLDFPGRLAVQQRVLPAYRVSFFETLAEACIGGLSVLAGQPLLNEKIAVGDQLVIAHLKLVRNWHLFQPGSPFYQCFQEGLLSWLKGWQPEVLIVEANPRYLSTSAAVRWMHAQERAVIGWGLGAPEINGLLSSIHQRSRKRFLDSLDGVIAYSQRGAEEYCRLGVPSGRVFVAPNAVAHQPRNPPPERVIKPGERLTVLFVGRLQARKRVDNLIRACAGLPDSLQPRLVIVGEGPERPRLHELAAAIYPFVELVGERRGTELTPLFASADLFVLPGTGGLAIQEAMSYGLPVIVAEGDGTQDDLIRPENGWRVRAGNLEDLQDALREALSDLGRLRRMGEMAYRRVFTEFNLEAMVDVFIQSATLLKH